MFHWIGAVVSIILVDLALSGDNALVIGAAASRLPRKQRWCAILLGGGGAIALRILFAIAATLLLQLSLLQAIGGVILLYIAFRLLLERSQRHRHLSSENDIRVRRVNRFLPALLMIITADVTMSLDNVLAIGAIADGDILTLSIGLFVSVAFILFGSALVAELIGRIPLLLDAASLVLAWTASMMILNDTHLGPILDDFPWTQTVIPVAALGIMLIIDLFLWRRDSHRISHR